MKRNIFKQIMSFAIVIAMLAAVCPQVAFFPAQAAGETVMLDFAGVDDGKAVQLIDISADIGNWVLNRDKTDAAMLTAITTGQPTNFRFQGAWGTPGMKMHFNANFGKMVLNFQVAEAGTYDLTAAIKSLGANNSGILAIATEDGNGNVTELGTIDCRNTTPIDSWVSVECPEFAKAILTKGTNYLILTGTANSSSQWPGNYLLVESFTFTRTGDYVEPVYNTVDIEFAELDYNGSAYWYAQLKDIAVNDGNWVFNRTKTDAAMLTQVTEGQPGNFQFMGIWGDTSKGMKANINANYGKLVFDFEVKTAGVYDLTAAIKSLGEVNSGILSIAVEDGNGNVSELGTIDCRNTTPVDSWVAVECPEFAQALLTKGTNHLILSGAANSSSQWPNNILLLQGFYFERTGDYVEPVSNTVKIDFLGVDTNSATQLKDVSANNGNWVLNTSKTDAAMMDAITTGQPGNFQFMGAWGIPGMKMNVNATLGKLVFDFNVKSEGSYDLTAAIKSLGANNSGVLSISVEDGNGIVTELGVIYCRNTTPIDTWVYPEFPEFAKANLTKGTNHLILTGVANSDSAWPNNILFFESLTFERTGDYVEPVSNVVELKFAELDYSGSPVYYTQLKNINVNIGNWALNREKTDEVMLFQIDEKQPNNFLFQGAFGEASKGMKAHLGATYGKLVFDFEVKTAGAYDLTAALKALGANNTGVISVSIEDGEGDVTEIGTVDGRHTTPIDSWVSVDSPKFKNVYLTKGTNYLILEGVSNSESQWPGNYWLLQGFTFNRTGDEVVEEPAYEQGDINGDGKLNTRDVTTLRRYLAGGYEDSITVIEGMTDVNGDGRENTRDVAALRALIAG